MALYIKKRTSMFFDRGFPITFNYNLYGEVLQFVSLFNDLGVV